MANVLIVAYLLIVLALIAVILLQRSEGGALGIGGGGGGFMTARGSANLLTRTTAILATLFFLTAIGLTMLSEFDRGSSGILERAAADRRRHGADQRTRRAQRAAGRFAICRFLLPMARRRQPMPRRLRLMRPHRRPPRQRLHLLATTPAPAATTAPASDLPVPVTTTPTPEPATPAPAATPEPAPAAPATN